MESTQKNGAARAKKIGRRITQFLKTEYPLLLAPFLVAAVYLFGLWQGQVYPFGKYTAASYDFSAQICPFIEHLFDVLQGKSSLTYTYALGGGVDVVGSFLYFFISPFSFVFLLCGDGKVACAATFVMLLKMATIAFSGAWFAKKLFSGIPDYLCTAIGVVYAYCGYTFVANTYVNWLDFLIYLPFAAGAFRHFVKTENFVPFAVLVAACVYTCFSIACFSMFIAFPTLVLYGVLCVEKERKNKFIAYLCLAFVVAILAAMPVLLPALASYLRGGRGGGLFDEFWFGYNFSASDPDKLFSASSFLKTNETAIYRKLSYILSDSVFLALTVLWFCRKGLKDRFAKFMLLAGVFTLLPVLVDEAMLLMNMGSYMSYALRFGFLNALYFLGGACLCLQDLCFQPRCAYDGTPLYEASDTFRLHKNNNPETQNDGGRYVLNVENAQKTLAKPCGVGNRLTAYRVWLIVVVLFGAALVGFLAWYVNHYRDFLISFVEGDSEKKEFLKDLRYFASSFAHSLGGLEVIFPLFLTVLLAVGLGALLVFYKKISPRLLSIVLTCVVGVQILFYNDTLVFGNRSLQHVELGDYQSVCQTLNENDEGYFRVKDYSGKVTACAPLTGGSNSFSVFSSMIDRDNFVIYQLFGYNGNGKNSLQSSHNVNRGNRAEEFGDSFLGYKYVLVASDKRSEAAQKSYLKPYMVTGEDGTQKQLANGTFYVYENVSVFPSAYVLPRGDFTFTSPNVANAAYRLQNQVALYQFLRGESLQENRGHTGVTAQDVAELAEHLWQNAADVDVGAGKITARVNAHAGECLFLHFVASKGYSVTVNGKAAKLIDNDLKFLAVELHEGENVVEFSYSSPYVRYFAVGAAVAVVGLCAVAFVLKKTTWAEKCAPVLAVAGITVAVAVVAVFMVYPTGACLAKWISYLKSVL